MELKEKQQAKLEGGKGKVQDSCVDEKTKTGKSIGTKKKDEKEKKEKKA